MQIQLFIPCFVDQLYPETALHMVSVLERAGCQVAYNPSQTCCGQPAFNAGYHQEAAAVAKKFISDFSGEDYIVSPSGSCTGYVRNYFGKLGIADSETSVSLVAEASRRVYEYSEFLVDVLGITNLGAHYPAKATYHDACGALRECGIHEAPRRLLAEVSGLELIEMKERETCCGFGGTFAVKYEAISVGMAQTKTASALEAGVTHIISTDMSCLMHLDGYIKKQGLPLTTVHIADVLASTY